MKFFQHNWLYLILLTVLTACDHYHEQHFYISNNLDSAILLHFDLSDKTDSTLSISQQTKMEIYQYGGAYGSVGVSDDRYTDAVKNLKVQTNDTIINLNESLWIFEKENKYHGNSTIKIDTTLFH